MARIIERADVAKASLYDCFGSKDELIRAYLEARSNARQACINEWISRYDTPQKKILGIFELLGETCSQPGYKGCAFVRARADDGASEKVKVASDRSRAFMLGLLTSLARDASAANPERLGQQLLLLYDGHPLRHTWIVTVMQRVWLVRWPRRCSRTAARKILLN